MVSRELQNWYYLFIFLCAGLIYTVGYFAEPALYFIMASLAACLILIWKIDDPCLRYLILFALLLRLSLALLQAYTSIDLPGAGVDSNSFEKVAWQNCQAWVYGIGESRTSGAWIYSAIIGSFYYVFGREPFIPQLINVYFSLLTIWFLYKTVFGVTKSMRAGRLAALIFFLIPSLNAFSAILLRETMLLFFVFISFYFLFEWLKEGRLIFMGWAFLFLVAAGLLHGVMILILVIHLFLLCFYNPIERRFRLVVWQLVMATVLAIGAIMLTGNYITYQLPGNLAEIITPDFIRGVVERKNLGRSTYLQHVVPYTYFDLIWQTPLRIIYFLFAPFPWAIETARDILGFIDVIIYTILFYFAIIGGRLLWYKNRLAVVSVVLIVSLLLVMFAWGTTNYGTAWRHKQKLAPFVIVLASVGVAASKRWNWLLPEVGETNLDSFVFMQPYKKGEG